MDNPDRERLRQHFSASNEPKKWDELWKNDFTPWDRGLPNPALLDLLQTRKDLVKPVTGDSAQTNRKLAFVPGCGKGYDVLLFASFGYDAVGLDASSTAIDACRKLAKEEGDTYPLQEGVKSRGNITFVAGDFFGDDWEKEIFAGRAGSGFDLIYDYTFLCALPISARPPWALRMSTLLNSRGRLICLEFPLYKDPATGGPPFALREDTYLQHLTWPGEELEYDDGLVIPKMLTSKSKSLIRLDRWKPERTHKIGEGTDHISVWTHTGA